MNRILIVLMTLLFLSWGCNDNSPCEPCITDEFSNRIEFYYYKCLDDSCHYWEEVIMDTSEGIISPKIRVIIKERLFARDSVNLVLLNSKKDTLIQSNLQILENDTRHIYYMCTIRLNHRGNYYAYAYYLVKGIKKKIPPKMLVFR